jgi:hypothetical protein
VVGDSRVLEIYNVRKSTPKRRRWKALFILVVVIVFFVSPVGRPFVLTPLAYVLPTRTLVSFHLCGIDGSELSEEIIAGVVYVRRCKTLPMLLAGMTDASEKVRSRASAVILRMSLEKDDRELLSKNDALAIIKQYLADPSTLVRVRMARAYWKLSGDSTTVVPLLLEGWENEDSETWVEAARGMSDMINHFQGAEKRIRAKLENQDWYRRHWAHYLLEQLSKEGE